VAFSYKIRRENGPPLWRVMNLRLEEFWRRFCLHILPERFVKIPHYGLRANRGRQQRIDQATSVGVRSADRHVGVLPIFVFVILLSLGKLICPACGKAMRTIGTKLSNCPHCGTPYATKS
jgi:hypothetical protein